MLADEWPGDAEDLPGGPSIGRGSTSPTPSKYFEWRRGVANLVIYRRVEEGCDAVR
jgi:hypothetical protein